VRHFASTRFWYLYRRLSPEARALADKNFALLKANPRHPSLHLKKTGRHFSVRIGLAHRALGIEIEEGILWIWIGSHAAYDREIGSD
jgi:hypothetical protein